MVHKLGTTVQTYSRWRWGHDEQRGDDSTHLWWMLALRLRKIQQAAYDLEKAFWQTVHI